ncbi:ABC-2 type transporter [Musa troglodytarum]|uniref:ABC-2 type transporter n=1 Tax=Musa troglodytarum TaxID=320322 RepID=A0A9E7FWN1_9LILI|nr:ABC-2 type transporter [Musa troglodytarum]
MAILNIKSYRSSATSQQVAQQIAEIRDTGGVVVKKNQASFMTQSLVLTGRCFVNMYLDLGYYCFGSIQARGSMLMFIAAFLTFMAIGGFPFFKRIRRSLEEKD